MTETSARQHDMEKALAVLAIDHGLCSVTDAARVVRQGRGRGALEASDLLDLFSDKDMVRAIGKERGIRYFDPYAGNPEFMFDNGVFSQCETRILKKYSALPLKDESGKIVVAVANPDDLEMVDYLRSKYPDGFSLVISARALLQNRISYYSADEIAGLSALRARKAPTAVRSQASARSPVQEWVDMTLERAISAGASDLHILMQPDEQMILRFRIDGTLQLQPVPPGLRPLEIVGTIVSRCSTMDAANFREPQDGKFSFTAAGRAVDARVALLPQAYGPTLTLRMLDPGAIDARLSRMGFTGEQTRMMQEAVAATQGTILTVGPTGSGKSTTLYALLQEVNATEKNVLTVENPIEYRLAGVGQTEIREGLGARSVTFARALRTILRADPDIILVGEIRDQETAEVAMQAAITGHLVLSTLHANTAIGAYQRLANMGVPLYLVAEALSLSVYQRLLRKLHDCGGWRPPTKDESRMLATLGLETPDQVREAGGCPACNGTGYLGRSAAVEVLEPDPDFRQMVAEQRNIRELARTAELSGFSPIHKQAYEQVLDGRTSVAELFRSLPVAELKQQWA